MPWLHPLIWIIYPMTYTPLYNPRIGWREDLQGPCISWRNHRCPHVSSRFSLRPTHWMISPKCHAQSSVPRAPRRYDGTPTSTCSDLGLAGTSFVNGAFAMGKYGKIIERHGKLWDFHWTKRFLFSIAMLHCQRVSLQLSAETLAPGRPVIPLICHPKTC